MMPRASKKTKKKESTKDVGTLTTTSQSYRRINPYEIPRHPPGFRLRWMSKRLRHEIGMAGWKPVTWEQYREWIGQNQIIAPVTVDETESMDGHVVHGNSVLCMLPIREYNDRRKSKAKLSNDLISSGSPPDDPDIEVDMKVSRRPR
ncbi:MAG: hypothetical protein GF355_09610 [Candidatus Eisenbacteria bacterium]|nr:hypothetical protein [Candidatus Eisenbacteria bacterium]